MSSEIRSSKPRVAIYDFGSCEGCELQIVNLEEDILNVVERVDIVSFREAMKEQSADCDIAFVEGSIQREMDAERLKEIRSRAKILIALGDCAVTGCVNKLRNAFPLKSSLQEVYDGDYPANCKLFDLKRTRALNEVVSVDFQIRGCPVRKEQFLYYVKRLSWMPLHSPMDSRFGVALKSIPVDDRSLVVYNPHKCILCRRCDVMCREALGVDALGMVGKGPDIVVATPKNVGFDGNGCIRCGQCVSSCSCGSLETKSCVPQIMADLREKDGMKIAVDSVALASYVEKNHSLKELEPAAVEKYVIGALEEVGFEEVIHYDRFLADSVERDIASQDAKQLGMLSWCKGAFNYVDPRIPASILTRSEENSPWSLLLNQRKGENLSLLTSCTALKGVDGFSHVLSVMEMDELFKQLEVIPEFTKLKNYDGEIYSGQNHPGFGPIQPPEGTMLQTQRISKDFMTQINETKQGLLDVFPCLERCLNGGGNYPSVNPEVVERRRSWLTTLWRQTLG